MDADLARSSAERHEQIATLLREAGRVSVEALAGRFGVSVQTIRRDLNEMSAEGGIVRVHGGAMLASGIENVAYASRKFSSGSAKRLIGEAAARLIPEASSLFINIGTTTEHVARALAGRSGLLVITNNLHVAAELYGRPSLDVIIAGGSIRASDGGIVGALTVDTINQFRVDTAIVGTSAIDADGTLLDFDIREVRVSRAIIENARRVILVTDHSKFGRAAPVRIASLSEIDVLVTDRLPASAAALCAAHQVDIVQVTPEGAEKSAE